MKMKMNALLKSLMLFAVLSAGLSSCHTVYYAEPQPVNKRQISSFPKPLRGKIPLDASGTMFVEVTKNSILLPEMERPVTLGDQLVLKRFARHFIVSIKQPEGAGWDVYAVRRQKGRVVVKTLRLQKGEMSKINEVAGRVVVRYDADGDPLPIGLTKREFRKVLKELFMELEM